MKTKQAKSKRAKRVKVEAPPVAPAVEAVAETSKKPKRAKAVPVVKKGYHPDGCVVQPSPLILLVAKPPKDATVKGQGEVILTVLKEAGGQLTVAELAKKLEGRITTKNVLGLTDVVHMVVPVLRQRGLVKVKEA